MHTLESLDAALLRLPTTPKTDEDFNARATLMARRIELDQAAKATAAANSRPKPRGNLVVNVPPGLGTSHFHTSNRACLVQSRMTDDGRLVLDLFPDEFQSLLRDVKNGHDWHDANPEALRALGQP